MLDTLGLSGSFSCLGLWGKTFVCPPGWTFEDRPEYFHADGDRGNSYNVSPRVCFQHKVSGLRLFGVSPGYFESLEVSLPRLLHGRNDRLISSQEHLDLAIWRLVSLLGSVGVCHVCADRVTRADLVWNFPGRIQDFVAALRQVPHPLVRGKQREFFDTGLDWLGSTDKVTLYDKAVESGVEGVSLPRLEYRLRSRSCQKRLPHRMDVIEGPPRAQVPIFDFGALYRLYRDLCLEFQPRKILTGALTARQLVALFALAGMEYEGEPISSLCRRMFPRATWFRFRADMRSLSPVYSQLDFAALLPEDQPPASVSLPDAAAAVEVA